MHNTRLCKTNILDGVLGHLLHMKNKNIKKAVESIEDNIVMSSLGEMGLGGAWMYSR